MITAADFQRLRQILGAQAEDDIAWAEGLRPPTDCEQFALEAIFVICNSGMKNTVARGIFERVRLALFEGRPVLEAFKHPGKAAAIEWIWAQRAPLHEILLQSAGQGGDELLAFCARLPWIGGITKYHLAKNFGADVAKPDVHLQRLADREGCTAQALCERLAAATGWRIGTVDTLLWRACALGLIDSPTGHIQGLHP